MSNNKILFFCPQIYPEIIGGIEIFYYYLIDELSKKRELIVFTTSRKFQNDNCEVVYLSRRLFLVKKYNLGNLSLLITTVFKLITYHKKISLIHLPCTSNSGFYGYIFYLVKKLFGIPYLIQFHGGGMHYWRKHDGNRLLFQYAEKILAVSTPIKEEYEKRINRNIEVLLPLIPYRKSLKSKEDLKRKNGFTANDNVMIMVGSIKPLKGNIWVYESFKRLPKDWIERYKLKLLYVGTGTDLSQLADRIKNDGMGSFVRIIDGLPNENINEIYGLADYYLIASDFEGTPKSLLEALYNGLPIIGSNVSGINNIIRHRYNGLLVDHNSIDEMVTAIKELVSDFSIASKLGKMARLTYEQKFDFSIIINRLMEVYDEFHNKTTKSK